jgi:Ca-activated chloride channel family protein
VIFATMPAWMFMAPGWLVVLAALPGLAVLRRWRRVPVWVVPHAVEWRRSTLPSIAPWAALAAYAGCALLIVALARPVWIEEKPPEKKPGYDIVLAIDLSTSMYAEDFQDGGQTRNRLQAVKPIIEAFINRRPDDRIGIVVFAGRAYTFAPLTFDHDWLRRQTARLAIGAIEDGTAIGDALGVSLARLRQGARYEGAERLGSFIILLTDGASNRGALDPRQAAGLAAEQGVAIYGIGAGAEGLVPMPVFDYQGKRTGTELRRSEIDDLLLRDLAEKTKGLYFRATDAQAIARSFAEIDRTTRREFVAPPLKVTRALFPWFLTLGTLGLAGAMLGVTWRARKEAPA